MKKKQIQVRNATKCFVIRLISKTSIERADFLYGRSCSIQDASVLVNNHSSVSMPAA